MFGPYALVIGVIGWSVTARSFAQKLSSETDQSATSMGNSTERSCLETIRRGFLNPLTLAHGEPIGTNCRDICVGRNGPEPSGKFWYPGNDCRAYINCVNWEAEAWLCPFLHIFDATVGKCALPESEAEKKRQQCGQPIPSDQTTPALDYDPTDTEHQEDPESPMDVDQENAHETGRKQATAPAVHDDFEIELKFKPRTTATMTTSTTTGTATVTTTYATTSTAATTVDIGEARDPNVTATLETSSDKTSTAFSVSTSETTDPSILMELPSPTAEITTTDTALPYPYTESTKITSSGEQWSHEVTALRSTGIDSTKKTFLATTSVPVVIITAPVTSSARKLQKLFFLSSSVSPRTLSSGSQNSRFTTITSSTSAPATEASISASPSHVQYEVKEEHEVEEKVTTSQTIINQKKPPASYGRYRIPGTLFKFPLKRPRLT